MEVREARLDERAAIVSVWERAGLTRPWNDPHADFDRAMGGATSTVLAGFEGDQLVATVMVGHDGHRGAVYYLSVEPAQRGKGFGRGMMTAAQEWLRARGAPKLNLMVRGDNDTARSFYESIGYEASDVTVLARWLTEPEG